MLIKYAMPCVEITSKNYISKIQNGVISLDTVKNKGRIHANVGVISLVLTDSTKLNFI